MANYLIMENTLLISFGALILSVILLIVNLAIARNIKRVKNYSYMQVMIMTELAKKDNIEIDLDKLYAKADNMD
jgi:hypothetical protein